MITETYDHWWRSGEGGVCKNSGMNDVNGIPNLLLEMARHLVDRPDAVTVESMGDEKATLIRLKVGHGEAGKVIGKQGRMARSIRTILSGISMKMKHRISLDIVEG